MWLVLVSLLLVAVQVLQDRHYFGAFGRIKKVCVLHLKGEPVAKEGWGAGEKLWETEMGATSCCVWLEAAAGGRRRGAGDGGGGSRVGQGSS
jgi:hypothetical protein